MQVAPHPAKFSDQILEVLCEQINGLLGDRELPITVLDPFAGVGRIHELATSGFVNTVGLELEPEWACAHPRTVVGNALTPPFAVESFDVIATSPCYGNRMADHHDARDDSKRITYKHKLGRNPSPDSSCVMQWGNDYKAFHELAWTRLTPLLKHGGLFLLNVSDHIRKGQRERVSSWHVRTLENCGLHVVDMQSVETKRMKYGANGEVRVGAEYVVSFSKP